MRARRFLLTRWPLPPAFLFAAYAWTSPQPHLFSHGNVQRTLFAVAAFAMFLVAMLPQQRRVRSSAVAVTTLACGWRVAILVLRGQADYYTFDEVVAWVVLALLLIQVMVLTWPGVILGPRPDG